MADGMTLREWTNAVVENGEWWCGCDDGEEFRGSQAGMAAFINERYQRHGLSLEFGVFVPKELRDVYPVREAREVGNAFPDGIVPEFVSYGIISDATRDSLKAANEQRLAASNG